MAKANSKDDQQLFDFNQPFDVEVTIIESDDDEKRKFDTCLSGANNLVILGKRKHVKDEINDQSNISSSKEKVLVTESNIVDSSNIIPEDQQATNSTSSLENIITYPKRIKYTAKRHQDENKTLTSAGETVTPNISDAENDLAKKQKMLNQVADTSVQCIKSLLTVVADNLLRLFPRLNKFLIIKNSGGNYDNEYKSFCEHKYHCFKISYSTVLSLILPQQYNTNFVRGFLQMVIHRANETNVRITSANVKILFTEMIKWTAFHKQQIENEQYMLSITSSKEKEMHWVPNGHAIAEPNNKISNTINRVFNDQMTPDKSNVGQNLQLKNMLTSPPLTQKTVLQKNPNFVPHLSYPNKTNSTNLLNHPLQQCSTSINVQSMQDLQTSMHIQRQSIGNNCCSRLEPPSYYESVMNLPTITTNNRSAVGLQQQLDQTLETIIDRSSSTGNFQERSSLSRDSGIISPSTEQQESTSTHPSLLITHVTSLQPNYSPPSGNCSVCGTQTVLSCMNCNRIYYCSRMCQKKDWDIHMIVCQNIF